MRVVSKRILISLSEKSILVSFNITPNIDPKSQKQVENHGGTQRDEGNINEIKAHTTGRNIHFFAQIRADAKSVTFD
jgi:hypothetical protein